MFFLAENMSFHKAPPHTDCLSKKINLTITEGKFHQIKRMFGAVGREVHFLKRIAMGGLALDPELSPGQYRALSEEELGFLR